MTITSGLVLIMAAALGCSSDGGNGFEATTDITTPMAQTVQPVGSPAPGPTATATVSAGDPTPLPRPTASPGVDPTSTAATVELLTPVPISLPPVDIDLASLTVPVCRTTYVNSNGAGFGTIPHATPTAIPVPGSSDGPGGVDLTYAQAFVTALSPLVDTTLGTTSAADNAWREATTDDELARIITFEGRRLTQLCSALSIVPLTTDGIGITRVVADALNGRRALLLDTVELLRDQPSKGREMDSSRLDSTATLLGLEASLDMFAAEAGVTSLDPAPFTLVNPLLGASFDAPGGWLVVRNGIDIVIMAPPDQQVYSVRGLGPDAWKLGTALRVRRFRNNPPWQLSDTAAALDSLYARFGDRVDDKSIEIGGIDGILRIYRTSDGHWDTFVGATVLDNSTYLFEYGCPDTFVSECAGRMETFLNSVELSDG